MGTILAGRNPVLGQCPQCIEHATLRRSRAHNWYEKVLHKATYYKSYRCKNCGWRGHISVKILTASSIKSVVFYIVLAVLIAFLVFRILDNLT